MLSSPLKLLKGDFQQQNTPQKQTNKQTNQPNTNLSIKQ